MQQLRVLTSFWYITRLVKPVKSLLELFLSCCDLQCQLIAVCTVCWICRNIMRTCLQSVLHYLFIYIIFFTSQSAHYIITWLDNWLGHPPLLWWMISPDKSVQFYGLKIKPRPLKIYKWIQSKCVSAFNTVNMGVWVLIVQILFLLFQVPTLWCSCLQDVWGLEIIYYLSNLLFLIALQSLTVTA